MSDNGFIALPPDGAGKRVSQSVMLEVSYDNGTIDFEEGDGVSFSSSTWTGTVIKVEGTTATGTIHLRAEPPVPTTFAVAVGENIIVKAVTNAKTVSLAAPYYFQQNVIVGHDMVNKLEITELGSAHVTFKSGEPQFDAFGKLMTSEQTTLGEYVMSYDDLASEFTTEITGGATSVYDHDM